MGEQIHQYGQAIVAVILAALLSGTFAMFNRISRVEQSILHRDYLEERFDNIVRRVEVLEKETKE